MLKLPFTLVTAAAAFRHNQKFFHVPFILHALCCELRICIGTLKRVVKSDIFLPKEQHAATTASQQQFRTARRQWSVAGL